MPSDAPVCAFLPQSTPWFVLVLLSILQGRREIGDSVLPRSFFFGGGGVDRGEKKARVNRCCSCQMTSKTL